MPAWIISGQGRGGYVQDAGHDGYDEDVDTAKAGSLKFWRSLGNNASRE